MKSILRFVVVLGLVFGAALLWKADKRRSFAPPPRAEVKVGVNPQEEVDKALRPLRTEPEGPGWSKETFQGLLGDAFERNDPCAVVALTEAPAPVAPSKFLVSGMEVLLRQQRERPELLEALYAREDSPLYGEVQEDARAKEIRFFNALVESGQLRTGDQEGEPRLTAARNERAVETLRELIQEEPDNGAYQFFLAQALKQGGEKKEEVQRAYANAAEAKRFEPFYQGVFDNLQELAFENIATFAWVYSYLHRSPMPDFQTAQRNLRNWAAGNDTGKWVASRLANRLIATGQRYKETSPGYLYSQVEYVMGHNLRYLVQGRWEKNWEETAEKMREVRAFIAEAPPAVTNAELELYQDLLGGEKGACRFATWQALYDAYRAKRDSAT